MNNIFSLVNQVPAPISTPQGTAPPPSSAAAPVPSAGDSDPGPSNPTSSTHNPEPWNPPPLGETTATSSPVLVLYSRRLTAQTEALYSLLQTSLAEIKVKQEGLTKLLGQGESQVKVLEGVVGEVVGKVGGEVDRTLIQLRSILSTANSVLLAIDAKLIERESGNGSLLRRVDCIENRLEIAVAGVERVERLLIGVQKMEKKLFSHITQLAQRGIATGPCRCNEGSGIGGVNHDKRKGGMEQRGQKRNRDQSIEIPCSWNLENIIEVEGEDQKKREDEPEPEPEPEPELEPMPKPVPKRRRLMSDNEILEMELEEIKRIRATEVEGHGYSEGPGGFGEGYEGGFEEESMSEGRMIVEMEQGGDVSRVKTRAMAMAMKKRVLLTTQELLEEELL